jgi:hypothetical protein
VITSEGDFNGDMHKVYAFFANVPGKYPHKARFPIDKNLPS